MEVFSPIEVQLNESTTESSLEKSNVISKVVSEGECGDNLKWMLFDDGLLSINGSGEMWDYTYVKVSQENITSAPWGKFISQLTALELCGDITKIGEYAFFACEFFTGSLTIPDSVTEIGEKAFYWCKGFTGELIIPSSVDAIGKKAFYWCKGFSGSLTIST